MQYRMPFLQRSRSLLLTISFLSTLQGCQAMNHAPQAIFNTQQSARDANQALQASNPAGISLDDAVRNMEQSGFRCRAMEAGEDYQSSILCTISTPKTTSNATAPLASILWNVLLDSTDGQTLSRLVASRTPKDLGE